MLYNSMYIIVSSNSSGTDPLHIIEALSIPFLVVDREFSVVSASEKFCRVFGNSNENVKGLKLSDLLGGLFDTAEVDSLICQVPENEESTLIPVAVHEFGELGERVFSVKINPLPGESVDKNRFLVSFVEVTESVRKCNRQLYFVNRILCATTSSMEASDILSLALQKTVELMDFDAGALYCVNKDRTTAEVKAYYGMHALYHADEMEIDISDGHYRDVLVNSNACYWENYLGAPHEAGEMGVFSMATIPVMIDNSVIGFISIASSKTHCFTGIERDTLETIGREIGGVFRLCLLNERLEEANEQANLYLDVMTHDINNANAIAMGYADLMKESLDGELKAWADKVFIAIGQSSGLIKNISLIRGCHEHKPEICPTSLDGSIRGVIACFPDANISYAGCSTVVLADGLLSEVFVNLIGNSIKFGGDDVEIAIIVRETGGLAEISVADTGSGISDELKPVIFNRLSRGCENVNGKGLGLYIVKMLVGLYGGTVHAGDRIPGCPANGVSISFTLNIADNK